MMTGCGPARHGVFDHRYFDAAAGRLKVNHAKRVRVPTFWHQLSDSGRSVISLNLPVTYPPLNVRGIVVSGMDALRTSRPRCPVLQRSRKGSEPRSPVIIFDPSGNDPRATWPR